jgi:hypothetical protein
LDDLDDLDGACGAGCMPDGMDHQLD